MVKRALIIIIVATAIIGGSFAYFQGGQGEEDIAFTITSPDIKEGAFNAARLGYFHGGRTHLLYRAYINDYFEKEGVDVKFFTKALHNDDLFEVPRDHKKFEEKSGEIPFFGRMTGIEIIDEIKKGNLDGGVVGEASFLSAIDKGFPIIAVAELGHDTKERPGHAVVLRNGLVVKTPNDLKGKVFASRRSGPIDRVLLREFLVSEGVNISDVTIIDDMPDDELFDSLASGEVDGGYHHLHWVKKFIDNDIGYVYRKLDWMSPEASSALLVFNADYLEHNKEVVQRIVNAYVKRIQYEKQLSEEERVAPKEFGLQMVNYDIEGMNIPQYDLPPVLRLHFLKEVQDLLFKYGEIGGKTSIENYLDFSFVEEAMKNINKQ